MFECGHRGGVCWDFVEIDGCSMVSASELQRAMKMVGESRLDMCVLLCVCL